MVPLGIRNGSAPDTFNLPQTLEPAVAISEGWLQPIDDYVPDFENWKKAYPDGAYVEGVNVFDGKTYGFTFSGERRYNNALLFDQQMMNDAGYDQINADHCADVCPNARCGGQDDQELEGQGLRLHHRRQPGAALGRHGDHAGHARRRAGGRQQPDPGHRPEDGRVRLRRRRLCGRGRAASGHARRRLGVPGLADHHRPAGARVHHPGRRGHDHPGAVEHPGLGEEGARLELRRLARPGARQGLAEHARCRLPSFRTRPT